MATNTLDTITSAKRNQQYKDIDLSFIANPLTGDIGTLKDIDAIKRSLLNILLTNHYEKPFNPDFGSNLRSMLFENIDPHITQLLQRMIATAVTKYEKRVSIIDLIVEPQYDEQGYVIKLTVSIVNSGEIADFNFFLERVR